ncbi:MAG: hypothetical protein JWL72_3291 [Ilumatobacteraceae bacterium]|nr:hypothetical protein [Ilumatobacteraceae bacterium]
MKRFILAAAAVAALAGGSLGASAAHASEAYPPGGKLTVAFSPIDAGSTETVALTGFCGGTVSVSITGPETLSFTASSESFSFTVPKRPGTYTIKVTGNITCTTTVGALAESVVSTGSASGSFVVKEVVASAGPTPSTAAPTTVPATTDAPTTTTILASAGPVPTTSSVLAAPAATGSLPTTGSDSSYTLQLALALAGGGLILLFVARFRRQQRTA